MKSFQKRARRGGSRGKGLFVSIYGLAASGARAAMYERGAPGARGRAGCVKNKVMEAAAYINDQTEPPWEDTTRNSGRGRRLWQIYRSAMFLCQSVDIVHPLARREPGA